MEDCSLRVLPEWFGQTLTGLTRLVLTGGQLQQLPESFESLQQLQVSGWGSITADCSYFLCLNLKG
jgi:hypothetical protein